jgi:hypothetical protein
MLLSVAAQRPRIYKQLFFVVGLVSSSLRDIEYNLQAIYDISTRTTTLYITLRRKPICGKYAIVSFLMDAGSLPSSMSLVATLVEKNEEKKKSS